MYSVMLLRGIVLEVIPLFHQTQAASAFST